jgi:hypothetical protein
MIRRSIDGPSKSVCCRTGSAVRASPDARGLQPVERVHRLAGLMPSGSRAFRASSTRLGP